MAKGSKKTDTKAPVAPGGSEPPVTKSDDDRYNFGYWVKQIEAGKKEREEFLDKGRVSINIFKKKHKLEDCDRAIGVWWSVVSTLLPAYFSKVPKVDVELRKRRGNLVATKAAVALETATQYSIENDFNFQGAGFRFVLSYVLIGQGVLWSRYEAESADEDFEYPLKRLEDGKLVDGDGVPYENKTAQIYEREGRPWAREKIPVKKSERARLDCLHYDDFYTSVSRTPEEIEWKARESYLSREACELMFGAEALKFNYNSHPQTKDKSGADNKLKSDDGKAKIVEIWHITTRSVFHLHNGGQGHEFLQKSRPPVDYEGFWPCVELDANLDLNSSIPFSDFQIADDLILEVERETTRIHACLQAIKINFLYDSALGDEVTKLLQNEFKGVPVTVNATAKLRGGLANSIQFHNIEPYINGLKVAIEARETASLKLYEILACPDQMRGQTDAQKTATANDLENRWTSFRFVVRREQVCNALTEGIRKVSRVITQCFSDETIYEAAIGEDLVKDLPDPQPAVPPPPGLPPIPVDPFVKFQPILALLRDNTASNYTLTVQSDSLTEMDQRAERAERVDFMKSVGGFLEQLQPFITQFPAAITFARNMLQFVIRSYRAGKELEGDFMQTFDAIAQTVQQGAANGQQDPKAADNAAKVEVAQIKAQSDSAKIQAQLQLSQMDAQTALLDAKVKLAQLEVQKQQAEYDYLIAQSQGMETGAEIAQSKDDNQTALVKETMDTQQEMIKAAARRATNPSARRGAPTTESRA
jgi:hypothetical protein